MSRRRQNRLGGEIQINDARLLFDNPLGYPGYSFVRCPFRSISVRPWRSSAASPPFARRKHLRNGVPRLPSLKRCLVLSYTASAVRNAIGSRAPESSGRASAGITGIHSTRADSARDAAISGKSLRVFNVERSLHTGIGT